MSNQPAAPSPEIIRQLITENNQVFNHTLGEANAALIETKARYTNSMGQVINQLLQENVRLKTENEKLSKRISELEPNTKKIQNTKTK
jgi:regulator of replication initiation timing